MTTADIITILAALLGATATVGAALISNRQKGPAGEPRISVPATPGLPQMPQAAPGRVSRAFWCGIAGLVLWIIPILAYVVVLPGIYAGVRDIRGPRRLTAPGLAMCSLSLLAALINTVAGAYAGAHGTGWWQHQ